MAKSVTDSAAATTMTAIPSPNFDMVPPIIANSEIDGMRMNVD